MSDLKGFSDALREASTRREQERVVFNRQLGEPAVFVADPDDARFGIGYWKAEGGVVAYRKYVNGYDPFTRCEYTNAEIDILVKVRS
jgi:hypothetical protein